MALRLFDGLRPQGLRGGLRDALAGVTLASMNIPQVLGYTRIAGTPVVTGLYTVFLPLVASRSSGRRATWWWRRTRRPPPSSPAGYPAMAAPESAHYMALVAVVALLTAGLLLLARIFKLGFLADFLSRTVLVGFLTGVGFQVGIAMLGGLLGIAVDSPRTLGQLWEILNRLAQVHLPTLYLSVLVVGLLLASRYLLPRLPMALFVVVGTIAASFVDDYQGMGIATLGPVPGGLPHFALPTVTWEELLRLVPIAASCFVIIIAQSAVTAGGFAIRHHERVDEDADILGLSAANTAAALSGAFVVNGSPTQTAMAEQAGARSQVAQVVFAGVVGLVLLFLTGPLQYLPHCVLAGIVFTIAVGLVDVAGLRGIRRESPGEFWLAVVTAATVALVGVEQGILLAVALSLLRHVRHSYRPHTSVLAPDAAGRWLPTPAQPGAQSEPGLVVYRFGADLFYANASRFSAEVRALIGQAPAPVLP